MLNSLGKVEMFGDIFHFLTDLFIFFFNVNFEFIIRSLGQTLDAQESKSTAGGTLKKMQQKRHEG